MSWWYFTGRRDFLLDKDYSKRQEEIQMKDGGEEGAGMGMWTCISCFRNKMYQSVAETGSINHVLISSETVSDV